MNMLKKIKKKFFESLFLKSLKLIKKKPKNILYIILFDLLFIGTVYSVSSLFRLIQPELFSLALFYMLLNFLIFAFIYSFFKYIVLDYVLSFVKKTEFSFKRIKDFFILNLLIFIILLLIMIFVNIISIFTIKPQYLQQFLSVVSFIIFFFIYACLNISHSLFMQGNNWRSSFVKGNSFLFKKIKSYFPVYGFSLLALILLLFLGNIVVLLLRFIPNTSLGFYQAYMSIYSVVILLFLYALHIVNRLYFYLIVERVK